MKITALVDPETLSAEDPHLEGTSDAICEQMEFHVVEALRMLHHDVNVLPFHPSIEATIQALKDAKSELTFNLTEHVAGDRRKDMHITALLELLDLPYTGTGSKGF